MVCRQIWQLFDTTLTILLLSLHTVSEGLFVPWAIRTAVVQQDLSYRIPGIIPSFNLTDALLPLIFIVSALIIDGVALWRLRRDHKLGGSMSSTLKWVLPTTLRVYGLRPSGKTKGSTLKWVLPTTLRMVFFRAETRLRLYGLRPSSALQGSVYGLRPSGKTKGRIWLLGVLITIPQLLIAPCLILGTWDLPRVFLEQAGVNTPPELKVQAALIAVPVILASGALGAFLGANFGDIWHWNTR